MAPSSKSSPNALFAGLLIPIVVVLITAAARHYDNSKLDTQRFVVDSTANHYVQLEDHAIIKEDHALLLRMDSTLRRVDQKLDSKRDR